MEKNSPTRSVDRALDILDCFMDQEEMILLEISEKTGLSSSTVLRILAALQAHDYISKNSMNKTYHLGPKIAWLADHVPQQSYDQLKEKALPYMRAINARYNEDVRLYVPVGRYKMCIEAVESKRELRQVIKVGSKVDLVRGSAGKVILAYMSSLDRRRILGENAEDEHFDEVREQGYALSRGEREEGLFGIAVPVVNGQGRFIATITMSGPTARLDNEELEQKIQKMKEMGRSVSDDLSEMEGR